VAGVAIASCADLDGLAGGSPTSDAGPLADVTPPADARTSDVGHQPDGPRPTPDATPPDATADATSIPDAAPDASRDAPVDVADASPLGFCASLTPAPTFCADFDEGAVDNGWSSSQSSNGTIALDGTTSTSAPDSFVSTSVTSTANVIAALFKDFGTSGSAYHLAFDLRVDAVSANAQAVVGQVQLMTSNVLDYGLSFIVTATDASIEESYRSGGTTQYLLTTLASRPVTGQWTRVFIDVTAPPGTVTVHYGATLVLDHQTMPTGSANGIPTLGAGLEIFPTTSINPCKVHLDDLTFQIDP
jgi:hypothetical protein